MSDPYQTDEDSDYVPEGNNQGDNNDSYADGQDSDSSENEFLHVTPAKTRKRKRNPETWKDTVAKTLRIKGKAYNSRKDKP